MLTDSHFMIGAIHDTDGMPCQDYARSLVAGDAAFAIVSDGCSTGGETDNGSRIVVNATAQSLRRHWLTARDPFAEGTVQQVALEQRIVMGSTREMQGLTQSDLYATSVYAYYTLDGGFAHILGDGTVAWEDENGTLTMVRFEWVPPGYDKLPPAPFYPAYYSDNYKAFLEYYRNELDSVFLFSETWVLKPDGLPAVGTAIGSYTLTQAINGPVITLPAGLRKIAVFTDGVSQIENIDWRDAVAQLLAFKSKNGVFATRRMKRFYRDAKKMGRGALDDLAYAVILNSASESEET